MSNLRDFTGKNRKFTGASGIKVSDDGLSSSDRVNEKGRILLIFTFTISPGLCDLILLDNLGKNVSRFVLVLPSNWE